VDAVWFVLLAIGALFALSQLPAVWSGRSVPRIARNLGSWWPGGQPLLRGYIRAVPCGIVGFSALLIAAISGTVVASMSGNDLLRAFLAVVYLLAGLLAVSCVLGALAVTLFNRPRFVVPPSLRSEPGAVAEWRQGRRRKTQ
jgi:hypothetical protein